MANATTLITIKMPPGMREMLAQKAKQNKRRVQDEFNRRLQASFTNPQMLELLRDALNPSIANLDHRNNTD